MNNLCPEYKKKQFPFLLHSYFSFSSHIGCLFCDKSLLNKVCFLIPSMYEIMKRNKNLKNPRNKNVCKDRFNNFLLFIKYMSI